jgi:predicted small lipoprotein YifL
VRESRAATSLAVAMVLTTLTACGMKGPPLAPLHLVPSAVGELTARRSGDAVEIRFALPTTNANGPEAIDLARIEIYAVTIGVGVVTPANRDLLTKARVIGTIEVKPPPVEGAGEPTGPPDKRPGPGEQVTFVDELTAEKLKPVVLIQKPEPAGQKPGMVDATPLPAGVTEDGPRPAASGQKPDTVAQPPAATGQKPDAAGQKPDAAGVTPGTPTAPGAPVKPPAPVLTTEPTRIYAIRGVSRGGRPGLPSTRVIVPLVPSVAPPSAVAVQMPTEKAVVVDWTPPVPELGATPPGFNIYRSDAVSAPLNPAPLAEAKFEIAGAEYGKEQCYVVRTVQTRGNVTLESAPSAPACLTPLDKFPPAAPKGLRAVAEDAAISLVWDQNTDADLGGYLILRGETPGDTLLPLTPQPIADANYRDATVKPGVRYVYVVVAVDTATPRNSSPPSAREEVTAR